MATPRAAELWMLSLCGASLAYTCVPCSPLLAHCHKTFSHSFTIYHLMELASLLSVISVFAVFFSLLSMKSILGILQGLRYIFIELDILKFIGFLIRSTFNTLPNPNLQLVLI